MNRIHLLVPDGIDDPARPSGGNRYDRELAAALVADGVPVSLHRVRDVELPSALDAVPAGAPALVDGLLLERAPAHPRPVVPLLHMPPGEAVLPWVAAAPAVIVTSAWTRDRVVRALPELVARIVVARPGVAPVQHVSTSTAGRRLRCVGVLAPHKGQDVLVEALGRIRHLVWQCTFIGASEVDPAFVTALRMRCADLGIARRVFFDPPPVTDSVAALYRGADLVVQPSRAESYGMALAEAVACGVPVVAADVGGVREALEGSDAGTLVPARDPDALAAVLREWLEHPEARAARTAAARRAPRRTWSAAARVVADALGGRPHAGVRSPEGVLA